MYTSLAQALKELKLRQQDSTIAKRVRDFLGGFLPKGLPSKPPACLLRQLASCRYEDIAFARLAETAGLTPFWPTYLSDCYTTFNPDKVNYVRIRIKISDSHNWKFKVINDWDGLDKKKPELGKVQTKYLDDSGQPLLLTDIHLQMRKIVFPHYALNSFDHSEWYKTQKLRSGHYYSSIFALFVCHGIMFEDYHNGPNASSLQKFVSRIVQPAFDLVEREIGLTPLMVNFPWQEGYQLYPREVMPVFLR
jgi:hypothetical protein